MKLFTSFLFLVFSFLTFAQTVVPVASIKTNNANGVPVDSGRSFTVTGIVTAANSFGSTGPGAIQDATGGLSIFGSGFVSQVRIGDSVTVTSTLTHFRGLTQFDFSFAGSSVVKHASNKTSTPEVVTIAQINGQIWNGLEQFESELIRINNVTISGSGNFAANTNYNISDATGTTQLRIDGDVTTLVGTPIPNGAFDIIGILSQFKSSAPYNSGYQLLPRSISDLVFDGAPLILGAVNISSVTTNGFTAFFTTARKGNSIVRYGLTAALELDSVVINDDTTFHAVPVTGLQSGKTYYIQAFSRNSVGTSTAPVVQASTVAVGGTIGTINVYFNYSVDTTVAIPGNAAQGSVNFQTKLVNRINSAMKSIDMAVYSFNGLNEVTDALILAKNRGVKVRIVYENRTMQTSMQSLINAGMPILQRPSTDGLMHNKFFVFDGRDTVQANDWVWTGSWNITSTELNWKNNVLEINDPNLAQAYLKEFEEMWGGSNDTPSPATARFGGQKLDNTPHSFTIGGREVLSYFSPSDQTTSRIINIINSANNAIYFSIYSYTRSDIANAMKTRNTAGAIVRGVMDQVDTNTSQFAFMKTFGDVWENPGSTLHHKYFVVDPSNPESVPTVLTGSHNWSTNAETKNDENTLIIKDLKIANLYMQEFKKRYNEAGGTGTFIVPNDINDLPNSVIDYILLQNYPNPFNPVTTIRVLNPFAAELKLEVFNQLGQRVATLFDQYAPEGVITVDFDGRMNGNLLPSGVYFYRLTSPGHIVTKKMMLMK